MKHAKRKKGGNLIISSITQFFYSFLLEFVRKSSLWIFNIFKESAFQIGVSWDLRKKNPKIEFLWENIFCMNNLKYKFVT